MVSFACPKADPKRYPLNTVKRVKNAMARYSQKQTLKCKGGRKRICSAYRKHGLSHTDAFQKYCKEKER